MRSGLVGPACVAQAPREVQARAQYVRAITRRDERMQSLLELDDLVGIGRWLHHGIGSENAEAPSPAKNPNRIV